MTPNFIALVRTMRQTQRKLITGPGYQGLHEACEDLERRVDAWIETAAAGGTPLEIPDDVSAEMGDGLELPLAGLSVREYFVGQALCGSAAQVAGAWAKCVDMPDREFDRSLAAAIGGVASMAVAIADGTLHKLNRVPAKGGG
jgi:hypothetical protein